MHLYPQVQSNINNLNSFIFSASFFTLLCIFYCNNRCLDSILHAEHKSILEEMRSDYYLTYSVQTEDSVVQNSAGSETQVVANGTESNLVSNDILGIEDKEVYQDMQVQQEKPILSNHGLDLRRLLRSLDKNSKKDYGRGSRFVTNKHHYASF